MNRGLTRSRLAVTMEDFVEDFQPKDHFHVLLVGDPATTVGPFYFFLTQDPADVLESS